MLHNHASIPRLVACQHTAEQRLRIYVPELVKMGRISKIILANYVRASIRFAGNERDWSSR
jgi:hypothetical protein